MLNLTLKDFFGGLLILTSLFDAWKYIWQVKAIKKVGTARGHSRKFINAAIFNDIIKLCYGFIILDIFIIGSSILALVTMGYNFYIVYRYYPYRCRGLDGFKRPNIFYYIVNSLTPNRIRKRL
jgi:hypothetical protein